MADSDSHDASSCGVCSRSLEGVLDPVTQRAVSEHLAEVSEAEQRLLSLTQQSWATGWEGILAAKCPVTLQSEMGRDLPLHPRDLIRGALVDDLFDTVSFQETLAQLKAGVGLLCAQELAKPPAFPKPPAPPPPATLDTVSMPLLLKTGRAARRERWGHYVQIQLVAGTCKKQ